MKSFLIIQNDAKEGAGHLQTLLEQRRIGVTTYLGWQVDYKRINAEDYSGLILLGGAQGVYESEEHPYLLDEIELSRAFIDKDKAVIGFCLGAQILATALGGKVLQNTQKEIGWFEIELEEEAAKDDVISSHPQKAMAYHFHGDYFKLPPDCVGLARSEMTECQLFRYKQNVYGFQYHAEVDQPLIEIMCNENTAYMQANGYDAEVVISEIEKFLIDYQLRCSLILNKWIDKAVM